MVRLRRRYTRDEFGDCACTVDDDGGFEYRLDLLPVVRQFIEFPILAHDEAISREADRQLAEMRQSLGLDPDGSQDNGYVGADGLIEMLVTCELGHIIKVPPDSGLERRYLKIDSGLHYLVRVPQYECTQCEEEQQQFTKDVFLS